MKIFGLFFTIIFLSSSISVAYAHPDPISLTVINSDNEILFESELTPKKEEPKSMEWFTDEWNYDNFIWILGLAIAVPMSIISIMTFREEIAENIFIKKLLN
jgi:hypothetical protein